MNSVATVFCLLAGACVLWAVVASVCMGAWLSRHGVKVHWILFRALMPWYVHRYRTMTKEMDGQTGPLFAQFVVPINLALLFAVAMIVVLAVGGR